jgi:hypothetical protein
MKTMPGAKSAFFAILVLAATIFAGCKTVSPTDWNSRVGHYTFNEAVADLGQPDKMTKTSDGKTVAQWITLHGHTGFSTVGFGPNLQQTYRDHVLELTFGTNDVLAAWARNY